MSETTKTAELNTEAGISGAAASAMGESAEILNLLSNDQADQGGSCCGGSCCSA